MIKKIWNFLISPYLMAFILITGAAAMAIATFIENDHGAAHAKAVVYNTRWFEALLVLFAVNLIGSVIHRKLYKPKKFTIFAFHLAFIVMIIGAGITRYFGYEGVMHIREGQSSNSIFTEDQSINVSIKAGEEVVSKSWDLKKLHQKSGFKSNIKTEDAKYSIILKQYIPDAYQNAVEREGGKPVVSFVLAESKYKGTAFIMQGTRIQLGSTVIAYDANDEAADIIFKTVNDTLYIASGQNLFKTVMGTTDKQELPATGEPAKIKQLYGTDEANIVVQTTLKSAVITAVPSGKSNPENQNPAYIFDIKSNDQIGELVVWANETQAMEANKLILNNASINGTFGKRQIDLPFQLQLDNFEIERYPGSHSPSSFSSYVKVIQPDKTPEPFHIYMNNILKVHGYRFYQSSYDSDEKGTILSVNYDSAGTTVTYIGYFILFLGIVLSIFNRNSFLKNTSIPKVASVLFLLASLGLSTTISASPISELKGIDKAHADRFGELLIQDNKGRTEPVYTFASDLMRKMARKETMYGLTPVQIVLDMSMDYQKWLGIPIIKVSNAELRKTLGISGNYAAYNDFIVNGDTYKLQSLVEAAFNKPPGKQSKFDKELIKVDERLNILYSIFSGSFLKLFPIPNSDDHLWRTSSEAKHMVHSETDSAFLANILPVYFSQLESSKGNDDYKQANTILEGLFIYQTKYAGYELPSDFKVKTEVSYYKWNVLKKLFPFYAMVGLILLMALIGSIISGKPLAKWLGKSLVTIIFIGFMAHTAALAIRWYISGHAPMSNGYESIVFIAWVTMLAGFVFSRQSLMALSATSVLAGFALMVANLSFMDPEITNLVPVLKSYWLTVHVSVITGSYGFLGLGAILGIINLVLTVLKNKSNEARMEESIENLTKINHRTLILGLYFLTIGTFLGAVWANESWGRYWGWDPKETWSLITMILYTFVTHARLIPGMRGRFAFNVLSIYAFFSVLMTYFGVNYYLSGLHSYGAGDSFPIPTFVYVTVITLLIMTIGAWVKVLKEK